MSDETEELVEKKFKIRRYNPDNFDEFVRGATRFFWGRERSAIRHITKETS